MNKSHQQPDREAADIVVRGRKGWDALGLFLADMQAEVGWSTGALYTGHTISKKGSSWTLVLRAKVKGTPSVSFYHGETPMQVYRRLWRSLNKGQVMWAKDKYAN